MGRELKDSFELLRWDISFDRLMDEDKTELARCLMAFIAIKFERWAFLEEDVLKLVEQTVIEWYNSFF